jgi:hypothetical protein
MHAMTSGQESSARALVPGQAPQIESRPGAVHPHVFDGHASSHHALAIEVVAAQDSQHDHISGRLQLSPAAIDPGSLSIASLDDRATGFRRETAHLPAHWQPCWQAWRWARRCLSFADAAGQTACGWPA